MLELAVMVTEKESELIALNAIESMFPCLSLPLLYLRKLVRVVLDDGLLSPLTIAALGFPPELRAPVTSPV